LNTLNSNLSGTLQAITDGDGNASVLKLSNTQVSIDDAVFTIRTHGANVGSSNIFGYGAGNNTFAGNGGHTGFGKDVLQSLTSSAQYNTAMGYSSGKSINTGGYNTCFGSSSGSYLSGGGSNTMLGNHAGDATYNGNYNVVIGNYAMSLFGGAVGTATINNGIYLGNFAGAYDTNSNRFIVNNTDRTDAAGDLAKSLLYGVMGATAADQTLRINAVAVTMGSGSGSTSSLNLNSTTRNQIITAANATLEIWNNPALETARFTGNYELLIATTSVLNSSTAKLQVNSHINAALPTGRTGLVTGDMYKDTAANILAAGDFIVAMKA
jgi:hypothetical protein